MNIPNVIETDRTSETPLRDLLLKEANWSA